MELSEPVKHEDSPNSHSNKTETNENFKPGQNTSKETQCGLFGFHPDWLQVLASKKTLVVVLGILGMVDAAIGSYYVATITTIEKRFKLPSSSSGVISSMWDAGGVSVTLFVAYYGAKGHKTRWVSYWSILSASGIIVWLLPHMIYGPGEETYHVGANDTSNFSLTKKEPLCGNEYHHEENCSLNNEGTVTYILAVIGQLMMGIGLSAYYSLGSAYLDDNVSKNKFPIIFGLVTCLRFVGQPLGYSIAAYALAIYINTDVEPTFGPIDPRWLGAWHLGWIPLMVMQLMFSLLLAFFPRMLPREAIRRQNSAIDAKSADKETNFFRQMKRLSKNKLLVYITISNVSYIMGMIGYWYFMPKYIETQYRKSPSEASIITGTVGLACTSIGILSSGLITSRIKPRATYLALWNVIVVIFDVIGHFLFIYIGCQKEDLHGSLGVDGSWLLNQTCNAQCGCDITIPYSPVCSEDGSQMYFSACHAGCSGSSYLNGTQIFNNCSCVGNSGTAIEGPCPINCDSQFTMFVALLCFMKFMSSTGRAGSTIIQYRAVAPEDKSMSIALMEFFLCIFALIPGPIIYGFIIDSTCQVWGYTCGERGNCLLYFGDQMRYILNLTASGFLLIASFLDFTVFRTVGPLKIWEDDSAEKAHGLDTVASAVSQPNEKPLLAEPGTELPDDDNDDDT